MMFAPQKDPRVFQMPIGIDFAQSIVAGLEARLANAAPADWARVTVIVNTARMQKRVMALFDSGPARLLPRVRLLTDVAITPNAKRVPPPTSKIKRRLELAQLIEKLLDVSPDLAPRSSVFDLADSLAKLMDEAHSEGVDPASIQSIDVSEHSAHWARSKAFLAIVEAYLAAETQPDADARQNMIADALIADWQEAPPEDPIILAGSTGSRGTTSKLMEAIATLPQGAVILPGFDDRMPDHVWDGLETDTRAVEDHPQYRLKAYCDRLGLAPRTLKAWSDTTPYAPLRHKLVSLSLRPAPTTDQWMVEGPNLGDLRAATNDISLIEAPSMRGEATAIAALIRSTIQDGKSIALIAPDRSIARQVTAALDRWRILPDDSAGVALPLTASGRFLMQVADLIGEKLTSEALLALLKNPLTMQAGDRGNHLRWTRDLELDVRRRGMPFPVGQDLIDWAAKSKDNGIDTWAAYLADTLDALMAIQSLTLPDMVKTHQDIALRLVGGSQEDAAATLWRGNDGRKARQVMALIEADAGYGGDFTGFDYRGFLRQVFINEEVREEALPRSDVMIWGTLEARIGGTDVVVLSGLNEGSWPASPAPDPWLNRKMRADVGLLSPDRKIGLSAHDYQIAMGAKQVVMTRSLRSSDAETVPSRWINRLTNLIGGLEDNHGLQALDEMRARGQVWLDYAADFEAPREVTRLAHRPSPRPPVASRPRKLSVTRFKTLVRSPYDIYASEILKLKPLDPLRQSPDAPMRGTIMHTVMERFIKETPDAAEDQRAFLMRLAEEEIVSDAPWPAIQRLWFAKFERVVDDFLTAEAERRKLASPHPARIELKGEMYLPKVDFTITAKADRIDLSDDGQAVLYDYKTGKPPTVAQQEVFDRQLLLQVLMLENGAFKDLAKLKVQGAFFLGLGTGSPVVAAPLESEWGQSIEEDVTDLIAAYDLPAQGYTARRMMEKDGYDSPYDGLSRFGEWAETDTAVPEDLT
ncbi:double-strand break repair protein AddB [Nereida sp. MMG025]|uniref:double-strand break repair protein AddB n=1 Tax=Nereida sp. MMG025 TaxID=2909981 RepID=UPI001F020A1C|nr:double-strand break repair protein AddB [Nereida sp. MMG025]MCF6444637.1 double-strand break repair protein AddB [Nereida sp. MMG025]